MKMEVRTLESVVRMTVDKGETRLTGKAVPYNILSDNPAVDLPRGMKEKILPRAFKHSIETDDIRLVWEHNNQYVLGRRASGSLRVWEDDNGVYFENIPPDVSWARDLLVSIKRQDISSMSFKFSAKYHFERLGDTVVQVIEEGRLHELSIVTEPVYESTNVYARSASGDLLVNGMTVEIVSEDKLARVTEGDVEKLKLSGIELLKKFDVLKKI